MALLTLHREDRVTCSVYADVADVAVCWEMFHSELWVEVGGEESTPLCRFSLIFMV